MSLNWGIIGTGNIAKVFANALKVARKGQLAAVGSRSTETAQRFGHQFGLESSKCYGSYQDLLADKTIDIVYISTPHPQHCELAIAAAKAGKHILVEKPMAMNEAEVVRILKAAKENNIFLMEAYMYRCHPQTRKAVELVENGTIGEIKLVRASFSFDGRDLGPSSRLWRNELGGGAIMDIGGYPLSFARLMAGAADKGKFSNPSVLKGVGHIQPDTQVDEWAIASLSFDNHVTAQLFTGVFADSDCSVEVIGAKGSIRVSNLWRPDLTQLGPVQVELTEFGKETQTLPVPLEETNIFAIEADIVADAILQGFKECPYMTWDDSLGQVRAMDQWRKEVGLQFAADRT
ncbi:uncharacterized protein BYT42DRAFT_540262 [Radiomyces spectabilis]|uniref:uncharacterized protein n=1 Tax=Radiomyces spectabilis TaxID=64574 RepID=UPI0022200BF2|nr:uncharacterized protein BYT42DRAFT_540262 [Radiomyces spectabilis]KAI8366755.1 hypothetical protein BYT42DRAFT_540262 [Radiomyces spectabilis]